MHDLASFRDRSGPAFGGLSLAELRAKFAALHLPAPEGLFERLAFEEELNLGHDLQAWGQVTA